MTVQLVRISPLRAANICGALYFVIFGAFSLVMFPFLNSMPTDPNVNAGQTEPLRWVFRWMAFVYPVFGGASSWFSALFGAALYNLIAPRIGGFALEFDGLGAKEEVAT